MAAHICDSFDVEKVVNPFEHRTRLSFWQKVQLFIASFTIFPLRVIGLILGVVLLIPVVTLATTGLPMVAKEPLKGWRRKLQPMVRGLLRFIFFCCSYHKIEVLGRENLCQGHDPDLLVAAPHTTYFDTIIIFAIKNLPTGISRIENIQIPFLGKITKFFTPISVTRADHQSRQDTIRQLKMRVLSRMKYRQDREKSDGQDIRVGQVKDLEDVVGENWPPICSFPEGTTGNGSCLINFKLGAFIPGQPVQPICIEHINAMKTSTWTWIGDGVWKILWMTMCQLSTKVRLRVLPLYYPTAQEQADPVLYASNVQKMMAREMGVPPADFNFFDCPLAVYLSKLGLQPLRPLINLHRLMNKAKSGECPIKDNPEELLKINLPSEPCMDFELFTNFVIKNEVLRSLLDDEGVVSCRGLFDAVAVKGCENIDIHKFLVWLCLSCLPEKTSCLIDLAFKVYDTAEKNWLHPNELESVLRVLFQCDEVEVPSVMGTLLVHAPQPMAGDLKIFARLHTINEDSYQHNEATKYWSRYFKRFFVDKETLMKLEAFLERRSHGEWDRVSDGSSGYGSEVGSDHGGSPGSQKVENEEEEYDRCSDVDRKDE